MGLASKLAATAPPAHAPVAPSAPPLALPLAMQAAPMPAAPLPGAPVPVAPIYAPPPSAPLPTHAPPPTAPPLSTQRFRPLVEARLRACVADNMLSGFYPEHALASVVDRVANLDLEQIAARFGYPNVELAADLVSLALYDTFIFWDDSGSMQFDHKMRPTADKIADLKAFVSRAAEMATIFDADGISMMSFKQQDAVHGIRGQAEVEAIMAASRFTGGTPIGRNLEQKVLLPYVVNRAQSSSLDKPLLVIIVFDGAPDSEADVRDAILRAHNYMTSTRYGPKAVAYGFLVVGDDPGAQAYLERIDNDPSVGHVIDCTSTYEIEEEQCRSKGVTLVPAVYMNKCLLGAIDRSYDDMD